MLPQTVSFTSLRAFVPCKDYTISRNFYQSLGFAEVWHTDELSIYKVGNHEFYLQNFYAKGLAENYMLALEVDDINTWWQYLKSLNLDSKFANIRLIDIEDKGWAKVCYLIDPSGVLWHFAQVNKN
jgi:catechol 2,3-dioxygenase-like lactoylglutathione lyase family enzyme